MREYKALVNSVTLHSKPRATRSGTVHSVFDRHIRFDMREGFPAVTTKKLHWEPMVGELLWFLNGETDLYDLRRRSCLSEDAWTIWTNDCKRWHQIERYTLEKDDLGEVYGHQWRSWEGPDQNEHDQIEKLVHTMKHDPTSRYMIVSAWNVAAIQEDRMALPPCHMMFQVYVDGGEFDLKWIQRSVDVALGLPFNIASYGLLMEILGKLTGLRPRFLSASLGDVHIYDNHLDTLINQCNRRALKRPQVVLPDIQNLHDLHKLTAKDFSLENYDHFPPVKFELSVG